MSTSGRTFKAHAMRDFFKVFSVTTVTIIHRMTELVNQGIKDLNRIL
jgi:hypothetical protein